MKTGIYIIWDRVADARFGGVMLTSNDVAAVRAFCDVADDKDPRNVIRQHPDDFDLRYVGDIQPNGKLTPYTDENGNPDVRLVYSGRDWANTRPPAPEPRMQELDRAQQQLFERMLHMQQRPVTVPDTNGEKRPWWKLFR